MLRLNDVDPLLLIHWRNERSFHAISTQFWLTLFILKKYSTAITPLRFKLLF